MAKRKSTKGQTAIYKKYTKIRLNIEQHQPGMNLGAPLVALVVLI